MKLEAMDACEYVGPALVYYAADVDELLASIRAAVGEVRVVSREYASWIEGYDPEIATARTIDKLAALELEQAMAEAVLDALLSGEA